jgi:hypothetical protein
MTVKSIFEVLDARCLGMQRRDAFGISGPVLTVTEKSTGEIKSAPMLEEWQLQARATVRFWATPETFADARRCAEVQLASVLYVDVLSGLTKASAAVWDGDRHAALRALDEIREKIQR